MSEEVAALQPPVEERTKGVTACGIPPKVEACLAILLGWITGLLIYCLEKNVYVLAWSVQSTILSLLWTIVFVIVVPIVEATTSSDLYSLLYAALVLLYALVWVAMLYFAWTRGDAEHFTPFPIIGKISLNFARKSSTRKLERAQKV
eukprot:TRINITY_DN22458_c0_g1_i1.p1 TRINITY_DN22458_c0_g1~~TRINITY_DN22458_c0_g1_i1.p1  ORF type:complete len:147 (-),score=33.62 TRINITY_DN22458_c0_g1_i1:159-599(-)